jgi:predicted nuclease of restriction endonuclease-like (RecB) superfamily
MRAFASAWPEREIVQGTVAQLNWRQNLALIEKLADSRDRLWYAAKTLEHGCSRNMLAARIETQAHRCEASA